MGDPVPYPGGSCIDKYYPRVSGVGYRVLSPGDTGGKGAPGLAGGQVLGERGDGAGALGVQGGWVGWGQAALRKPRLRQNSCAKGGSRHEGAGAEAGVVGDSSS